MVFKVFFASKFLYSFVYLYLLWLLEKISHVFKSNNNSLTCNGQCFDYCLIQKSWWITHISVYFCERKLTLRLFHDRHRVKKLLTFSYHPSFYVFSHSLSLSLSLIHQLIHNINTPSLERRLFGIVKLVSNRNPRHSLVSN